MKVLISICIILIAVFGFMQLVGFYDRTARSTPQEPDYSYSPTPVTGSGAHLEGLPAFLEDSLQKAQEGGVEELEKWLKTWGKHIQDPRLAWIELDYVVLLNLKNRRAAREKFQEIRARVHPGSPVYDRVRRLEPAYAE